MDALSLANRLRVRATTYVAGEPVPYFWPMRNFIHHNPLYGLEHLPFAEAVRRGEQLFHAKAFLPRSAYQRWQSRGQVDAATLREVVARKIPNYDPVPGIDWAAWMHALLEDPSDAPAVGEDRPHIAALAAALQGHAYPAATEDAQWWSAWVAEHLPVQRPLAECIDLLHGTTLSARLDDLVIKSCLEFFDEEQSSWAMPGRERGLFAAWAELARGSGRFSRHATAVRQILDQAVQAEDAIVFVMQQIGVDPEHWQAAFTAEISRLHGWAGFIRWRSSAKNYYWARRHPGDLVDFLAIRLVNGLALIRTEAARRRLPASHDALRQWRHDHPASAALRLHLHGGLALPQWSRRIGDALERGKEAACRALWTQYAPQWIAARAQEQASRLGTLARRAGQEAALGLLDAHQLGRFIAQLQELERSEGMVWLEAMEGHAIGTLLERITVPASVLPGARRPFAQAMFCIDVRSEPLRRHLEQIGEFQTFGIAGFFGVPVGFLGYGKGSEAHLCPAVVTPKNLVLEIPAEIDFDDDHWASTLGHVLHDLKSSVVSPFVTVEAVGMLFGLDLFGKTLAPLAYQRLRRKVQAERPVTRLLLDKLTREQAASIVRTLQRAMIAKALQVELGIERERVTDDMIRELRETALHEREGPTFLSAAFRISRAREAAFIGKLREDYLVDPNTAAQQLAQLGRIGYSVEEQANYVWTALTTLGFTSVFSRFILVVGHGSQSDNNPYESALDCGACGGNQGLVSARVFAQMANSAPVRDVLRERGLVLPADSWFVPALHNTTTDQVDLHDVELLPPRLLVYVERLRNGLRAASRLNASERIRALLPRVRDIDPARAARLVQGRAVDWSQVRPEWGLAGNAYAVIGQRLLTRNSDLEGRSFLLSYDWRLDPRGRLLENLLTGPAVVGEWINLEHYFSTVDNERFGSGSKVYHNVAGRFGVMTGSCSDLRTGLPVQTVWRDGEPYHQPMRLIVLIEAPLEMAARAVQAVVKVKSLVQGQWVRAIVLDPEQNYTPFVLEHGQWQPRAPLAPPGAPTSNEAQP
jgi:uncharacterized protein YbcC (UPF0753/DUF2309 family)